MPSPRRGFPVTGVVAPGTGVVFGLTGDSTAKSGSVSKLTEATPGVVAESGSVTKEVPFQTSTSLDPVISGDRKVAVMGLRNVPGYGEPLRLTSIPAPATAMKPACRVIVVRFGAVTVIVTAEGKVPAGMLTVRSAPSTDTGPIVPPAGPMVTVVTTAVNRPGGAGVVTGGGPYAPPAAVAAKASPAVPEAAAAPISAITDSFRKIALRGRIRTCRFRFARMNPPCRPKCLRPHGGAEAVSACRTILSSVVFIYRYPQYPRHPDIDHRL
jgi:hypothetical protein